MPASASPARVAAVLAGGRGSRLGGAKPTALLGGRPLLEHCLEAVHAAGLTPLVVAKATTPLPPLDCELLLEPAEPHHPLCGIVAALARHSAIVAVPCDTPFVSGDLLRGLASTGGEAAVSTLDGAIQPFPALYRASVLPALERALADEDSLRATLARLRPATLALERFGDPARLGFTVNTPADLAAAERL